MTLAAQADADASALLADVEALYDQGKLVAAHELGRALGPLACWPGTHARLLAGRLAGQLGANRLCDALILRAWRCDRTSLEATYFRTYVLLQRQGTFVALEALRGFHPHPDADAHQRADWAGLAAQLYAMLRDFETAERYLDEAVRLAPDAAFRWVERSTVDELQDRYAEALHACERALAADPCSRRAVHQHARLLTLHERTPEAIALLRDKLQVLESPTLAFQLAQLEYDTADYRATLATLALGERLAVLPDKGLNDWLAQRRCDAFLRLGEIDNALEQARRTRHAHYKAFVERVESGQHELRRLQLPVGFVRQHHMTCAPATLTAISRYWGKPADHLEVAEEICYDGTPHHSERRWAVEHGFVAREFRVTWDAVRALIERGVPFTLTTVYSSYAHLQAVIGFDALQGTLVIRDPTEPTHGEFAQSTFFEWSHANGPRGMLLVPLEQVERIEAVELPEAELYDLLHELHSALVQHRREDAVAMSTRLQAAAPGHRIALEARRSIANYDANDAEALAVVEALLQQFPEDVPLRLHRAGLIGVLRPHREYLAYLQDQLATVSADAMFALRLAQGLLGDAREHARAVKLLRRVLRAQPHSSEAWSTLADFHWQHGDTGWATELYRVASTLQITGEAAALTYFRAARKLREEERAITYLRARIEQLGRLSSAPYQTLYQCMEELERTPEGLDELMHALGLHQEDTGLMLFSARQLARAGDFEHAWLLLERARSGSRRIDWLRSAASVHELAGDLPRALELAREVTTLAPLDLGAQRDAARLIDAVEGRSAAVAHLSAGAERFPHHWGLNQLLAESMSDEPLARQEQLARHLAGISPDAAWAHRELATVLAQQQRFEEALVELERARALAPASPSLHTCAAHVHMLRGDRAAAQAACREALSVSVDIDYALQRLLDTCATREERRDQLSFVYEELKRQVTRGDGMYGFQQAARGVFEPEELLAILREGLTARPDLWQAWVAVIRQLAAMNQLDQARLLCEQTVQRFPMLPRVHLERAEIMRLSGDRADEQASLREALRLSPGWAQACCRLADSLEAESDLAGSRAALESAVRHAPGESYLHGYLADVLWRQGEHSRSVEHLILALRMDPGYEWAWSALRVRGEEGGEPGRALTLAREITAGRPGDARSWLGLAVVADDQSERLEALEHAARLAPLWVRAQSRRVQALTEAGRYDEALAALSNAIWGEALPAELRAQRARIQAARGDLAGAVATMRTVLAEEPQYLEGWGALADWCLEVGDKAGYLATAEQLHRLAPNDPVALGYLAHANRHSGTGVDVRPWLRQALRLKPDYAWGAGELFDLELAASELEAAQSVLTLLKTHADSPRTAAREIALFVRRRDKRAALQRYRELLRTSAEERDAIRTATGTLQAAGWRYDAKEALELAVRSAATHPAAGAAWVNLSLEIEHDRFVPPRAVLESGELGRVAGEAYLDHLARTRNQRRLRRLLRGMRNWLAADDRTWAMTGYALLEAGLPHHTCRWLADWRTRKALQPWMLLNAALALRDLGRDGEADEVSRHALGLARDHASSAHEVWLAADMALGGRHDRAAGMLAGVHLEDSDTYYRALADLTRALVVLGDPARDRRERWREAIALIWRARRLHVKIRQSTALRRVLDRTLWRAALTRAAHPAVAALLFAWIWFDR